MIATDETVTLYNGFRNGASPDKAWIRTVIKGVSWEDHSMATITDSGVKQGGAYDIIIPITADFEGKTYLPDKLFQKVEYKSQYFTINEEDMIVRGIATIPPDDVDLLKRLENEYSDAATIMTWEDNCRGAIQLQHWYIGGA